MAATRLWVRARSWWLREKWFTKTSNTVHSKMIPNAGEMPIPAEGKLEKDLMGNTPPVASCLFFPDFGRVIITPRRESVTVLEPSLVRDILLESGVLLLRGFTVCDDDLRELAAGLGGRFVSHGAPHRPNIAGDSSLHLADPGTQSIHLHIELGYLPLPPDLLWFHCITPPQSGGATTVCDGLMVARELSLRALEFLKEHKIKYSAFWPKSVWSRYFHTSERAVVSEQLTGAPGVGFKFAGDRLLFEYCVSALLPGGPSGELAFVATLLHYAFDGYQDFVALEDGSAVPPWLLDELASLSERHTQEIEWQKDDVLIINNRRVLHGRREHADKARKLQVRMQRLDHW